MAPPPLVARIVGALDSSVDRAFEQLGQKAKKAGQIVGKAGRQGAEDASKALQKEMAKQRSMLDRAAGAADKLHDRVARNQARAAESATRAAERAAERRARAAERAAQREMAAARKAQDAFADSFSKIAQVAAREMAKVERAQARTNRQAGQRFAERTGYAAARFLTPHAPLASMARRTASELARGLGVDFDLSSSINRGVQAESMATALTNQALISQGTGIQSKRQASSGVLADTRSVANKYGISQLEALEGLSKFTALTSDLATGRAMLGDMAKLSVAMGASLADVIESSGAVATKLGEPAQSLEEAQAKATLVMDVMNGIAGQTKLGAVEFKELATQMSRIAGNAGAFEGDRGTNVMKMGALAQLAREGTATSAADAARSVSGFSTTMKKGARINAFKKAGIDVFTDKTQTKIKDPFEIIKDSLLKTGGSIPKMNKMFMDVLGAKAVETLSTTFKDAGGGSSGIAAVQGKFDKLMSGKMTKGELDTNVANEMNTTARKAQQFQNKLDEVSNQVRERLMPALDKLAPKFLELANILGNVATWVIENPKAAIGTAIGLSIARAGLENMLRAGIERMLLGKTGMGALSDVAGTGTTRAGAIGSVVSGVGAALSIASLAVAAFSVANMFVDHLVDKEKKGADEAKNAVEEAAAKARALEQEAAAAGESGDTVTQRQKLGEALAVRQGAAVTGEEAIGKNQRGTLFGKDFVEWKKLLLDELLGHDKGEKTMIGGVEGPEATTDGYFGIRGALDLRDKDIDPKNQAAINATEALKASTLANTEAMNDLTNVMKSLGTGREELGGRHDQLK